MLRALVARTSTELASAVMGRHKEYRRPISDLPYASVTPAELSERLNLFQSLLQETEVAMKALEANETTSSTSNNNEEALCMAQLAEAYQLKPVEVRIIQFLVTTEIEPCPSMLDLVLPQINSYTFIPGS